MCITVLFYSAQSSFNKETKQQELRSVWDPERIETYLKMNDLATPPAVRASHGSTCLPRSLVSIWKLLFTLSTSERDHFHVLFSVPPPIISVMNLHASVAMLTHERFLTGGFELVGRVRMSLLYWHGAGKPPEAEPSPTAVSSHSG